MIRVPSTFTTANAILAKQALFILTIETYGRVFTNYASGVAGQFPWIEGMGDLSISVNDLDGGADLGTLSITVQDRDRKVTADLPWSLLEGRRVTLKTGLPGMSQADFPILFTGIVDTIEGTNNNQSYVFNCTDTSQVLSKVVYGVGDSGRPTDSNNPRTLNGHPIDILVALLTDEVGIDPSDINLAKLYGYRDSSFAGLQYTFSIESPPTAKEWIEAEIMQPLGGYRFINSKGQHDFNFFYPIAVIPVYAGSLIGAFVDGTGQLVAAPFLIANGVSKKVPVGAVALQMGVNDQFYTDNAGGWDVIITGVVGTVRVDATRRPWSFTAGINSAYPGTFTGSAAPTSSAVTAGTTIAIELINYSDTLLHGVSIHGAVGVPFNDGVGYAGVDSPAGSPGLWATPAVLFKLPVMELTIDNTLEIPQAQQAELINVISFRFDKSTSGTFFAESIEKYARSIARFGEVGAGQLYGQQIIESQGMRSGLQGYFMATFISRLIFLRYGLKNLQYEGVPHLWTTCILEPGDIVSVTNRHIPDRATGTMGITAKLMEVMDRDWNLEECTVTLRLLDASYLASFGKSLITFDTQAVYASATADEKETYMFMGSDSDLYSNGDAAHLLG